MSVCVLVSVSVMFCFAESSLAIPLILAVNGALTCNYYVIPAVCKFQEFFNKVRSLDFHVESFQFETHFIVNRISRDAGSFPWANTERGKPMLAESVVVVVAVSEAHVQIHTICIKTDKAASPARRVLYDVGFYLRLV